MAIRVWLGLALMTLMAAIPARAASPQRIVSLNVCLDQILVDLVPRSRIAAVSHLATDPLSVADPARAAGLPQTRGTAEDVLARDPDLILAGAYTTPATVDLLRRIGRRVEVLPQPDDVEGVRAVIRALGDLVGEPAVGTRLVEAMDRRIAAATAGTSSTRTPVALVYQPNDYVSGATSLIGEALRLSGYVNGADRLKHAAGGRVALETLVLAKPDLIVLATGPTTYRTAVADNLRHPALFQFAARTPTTVVPWPLWLCGTHHIATAIEQLAAARR